MWSIQLLGGLTAHSPQRQLTRFRTQKAASLLAYLAFHPASQPRETLIDMLWPEAEPEVGRHNLSNALSFLRHQLEPPGVPPGTVILADRASVRLNPAAVSVDAVQFENDVRQAQTERHSDDERLTCLLGAVERYEGALLPGYYEEWIAPEALRLVNLFVQAVAQLVPLLLSARRQEQALAYAQQAVSADGLSEEATLSLIQAYSASGQSAQALRAYRQLETHLQEELDAQPSQELQCMAEQMSKSVPARTAPGVLERVPPTEEAFALVAASRSKSTPIEPPQETAVVRSASPARLLGGEFLLRTTTHFFGREEEIDRLGRMLCTPRTRLVTLTGPGGTGKTRLALEVAAQLVERTEATSLADAPSSAVFVSLAAVTEANRLFDIILRSLDIVPTSKQEPLDQLANALDSRPHTLLVLDNFEQLVEEGALRVIDLLGKSAKVKLLVTSRQRLHIDGEYEFHLAPLPTSSGTQAPEDMLLIPSIALFVDRAQAVLFDFQLTERNASTISQLCDYLEGLPLAIELAAARVALLTPARILEQVQSNRLDFLATRRRDAESRHRTLRATLDWSYALLPEPARAFLAALSAFRGGWTLEAAQAVCVDGSWLMVDSHGDQPSTHDVPELLMLLRDSSLINVVDTDDGLRFTLLETICEYSQERRMQLGEEAAIRSRHRDWFLVLAEAAEPQLKGVEQAVWLARLDAEHGNLRAALAWSLSGDDDGKGTGEQAQPVAPIPLRLCSALHQFWNTRGHLSEGQAWCDRALQAGGAQERTAVRAKVLNGAGMLVWMQGDYISSRSYSKESLAINREIGDRQGIATSLSNLGLVAYAWGDYAAAQADHEESLAIRREIGDRQGITASLNNLGVVAYAQHDYTAARAYNEESLTIRRELEDKGGIASSLNNLGTVANDQRDYVAARALYTEALGINRETGNRAWQAINLNNLGIVAFMQGDFASSRTFNEESLAIKRNIGDKKGIAGSLNNLGSVALNQGEFSTARALHAESLAIRREIGDRPGIAELLAGFAALIITEMIPVTPPVETAEVTIEMGIGMRKAARLWAAAQSLREQIGAALPLNERETDDERVSHIRSALEPNAFAVAWEQGRAMTLEEAVACALEEGPTTA